MENNQTVGLSLDVQAKILTKICTDFYCPFTILELDVCPFSDKACVDIEENDWLEYLKNRQVLNA